MEWFKSVLKDEEVEHKTVKSSKAVEKPEPEMIDISVKGSCKFEVVKRGDTDFYHNRQSLYYVKFNYDVDIDFLGEKVKLESWFGLSPDSTEIKVKPYYRFDEEKVYDWLSEIQGSDIFMERLKSNIKEDIRKYVKNKNTTKLKEAVEKNNNFDFNFTFQTEKTSDYEIK